MPSDPILRWCRVQGCRRTGFRNVPSDWVYGQQGDVVNVHGATVCRSHYRQHAQRLPAPRRIREYRSA